MIMENTYVDAKQDPWGIEDSLDSLSKNRDLAEESSLKISESKSKRLVRRINQDRTLILKLKKLQLQTNKSRIKDIFLPSTCGLDRRIPKCMMSQDEKYLQRCLELIHISALKAASSKISANLNSSKMSILSDNLSSATVRSDNSSDLDRFVLECPLSSGTGSLVISQAGHWVVGSIMRSKSMMNILRSDLFHQYSALESETNFRKMSWNDDKGSICYDFMNSSGGFSTYSSQKLEKERRFAGNNKSGSMTLHKRFFSVSSTNSTSSEQSSSSASSTVSQGMLQCTWKGGIPHFEFSVDDQREVYVANLWKADSIDDNSVDYMYSFHIRKDSRKEHEVRDSGSRLVGKMNVSSTFTLCPNHSKMMETQFVLFGGNENHALEMHTSSHNLRKNKGISKVAQVFRSSHSSKRRTPSTYSAILEDCSWEPSQVMGNNLDSLGGVNLLENDLPPNLELAAIVMKNHLPDDCQEEIGGWGMKFLKKVRVKRTIKSIVASVSCECSQNTDDCSSNMEILVPAGLHGGPRTRNGGPSSLIERWRSGGHCDCGGWDLGCPLTVFKTRSSKEKALSPTDMQDECKSFDLFIEGSEHCSSSLRMVNVHDGLYVVHFQSSLSALQCFSIAVAFIHGQSPTLQPKNVKALK